MRDPDGKTNPSEPGSLGHAAGGSSSSPVTWKHGWGRSQASGSSSAVSPGRGRALAHACTLGQANCLPCHLFVFLPVPALPGDLGLN